MVLDTHIRDFALNPELDLKTSIVDGVYVAVQHRFGPIVTDPFFLQPGAYVRVGLAAKHITRISGGQRKES